MRIDRAIEVIRNEYEDLPGLKLTFWQIQRLLYLSEEECRSALQRLLDRHFLVRASDGAYVRGA
jgi:hypothetical protein